VAANVKGSSRFVTVTRLLQIIAEEIVKEIIAATNAPIIVSVHSQIHAPFTRSGYACTEAEGIQ
jgi:hypothetical protein